MKRNIQVATALFAATHFYKETDIFDIDVLLKRDEKTNKLSLPCRFVEQNTIVDCHNLNIQELGLAPGDMMRVCHLDDTLITPEAPITILTTSIHPVSFSNLEVSIVKNNAAWIPLGEITFKMVEISAEDAINIERAFKSYHVDNLEQH